METSLVTGVAEVDPSLASALVLDADARAFLAQGQGVLA
jgi:hypothetical protein